MSPKLKLESLSTGSKADHGYKPTSGFWFVRWIIAVALFSNVYFFLIVRERISENSYSIADPVDIVSSSLSERVHITHLFNYYQIKRNSTSWVECELVRQSWQDAAKFAQKNGVNVEFVNAVMLEDLPTSPKFARSYVLNHSVIDPTNGHSLPTIGEIFSIGKTKGKGELLVYTNADIGVEVDFYINMYKLAHLDSRDPSFQNEITNTCFQLMWYCLEYLGEKLSPLSNPSLCQEEVKQYYKLHGGHLPLWEAASRDVARLYVQNKTRAIIEKSGSIPSALRLGFLYKAAGGLDKNGPEDLGSVQNILSFELSSHYSAAPLPPTAFTVTRRDLVVDLNNVDVISSETLRRVLRNAEGRLHPGNDCFVTPRELVPSMVMKSRHMLGWRPWGMWIPSSWEWEFGVSHGLVWRNFESTSARPFTFHMGISGRVAENWVSIANEHPEFVLRRPAEWNEISQGRFLQQFQIPKYCEDRRLYRSTEYCSGSPSATPFCKGNVRLACIDYQNPMLRDPLYYSNFCEKILSMSSNPNGLRKAKREPMFCSFCKGLLRARRALPAKYKHFSQMCTFS